MSKFTVITNTICRSPDLVSKSIRASLSQDTLLDVVLVDQNEKPLVFPAEITNNKQFKHQHEVVPAVSQARNRAQYHSDCEWIIFCDDDGYLDQGYYQNLLAAIEANPDIEIFAGSIKRIDTGEFYSKRHAIGGDMKWFWNSKLLMGSNFVISRSVFEELGKFDEKFGAGAIYGSSEETDLAWNAFIHHKKMMYNAALVVFHVPPYAGNLKVECAKAYRYGVGKGRLVRKWYDSSKRMVLLEFIEMWLIPMIKLPYLLILFRWEQIRIQICSIQGRMDGLLSSVSTKVQHASDKRSN